MPGVSETRVHGVLSFEAVMRLILEGGGGVVYAIGV